MFSYFGAGINFADIALLKYGNVRDGRVQYVRKKTGKPINFLLTEEMRNIIVQYQRQGQTDEDYIFRYSTVVCIGRSSRDMTERIRC